MSDAFQNEQLLSALVDGELKGEDRARAERLLSENPQSQMLVQQWRRQSAAIKSLPRYQLDSDFAARVMSTVSEKSSVNAGNLKSPLSQWRTGIAAIITLAAMLLLTLFVFPNATELLGPMAARVAVAPSAKPRGTVPEGKFDFDSPTARPGDSSSDAADGILAGSKLDSGSNVDDSLELQDNIPSNPTQSQFAQESAEPAIASEEMSLKSGGNMSRSAEDYSAEKSKQGLEGGQLSRQDFKAAPPSAISGVAAGAEPTTSDPAPQRSKADPAADELALADGSLPALKGSFNQDTVNQVFVVDLRANTQPLETVSDVLTQNRIQIVQDKLAQEGRLTSVPTINDSSGLNEKQESNSAEIQDEFGTSNRLTNQSADGLEAIYVVASPSQMRQAIQQLSSQATVSGYQVPPQLNSLELQIANNEPESQSDDKEVLSLRTGNSDLGALPSSGDSMSKLVEIEMAKKQSAAQSRNLGSFRESQPLDSGGGAGGGRGGEIGRRQSASATQLRPYESNKQQSPNQRANSDSSYPIKPEALMAPPGSGNDGDDAVASATAVPDATSRNANRAAATKDDAGRDKAESSGASETEQSAVIQDGPRIDELFSEVDSEANSDIVLRKYLLLLVRSAPTQSSESTPAPAKEPD